MRRARLGCRNGLSRNLFRRSADLTLARLTRTVRDSGMGADVELSEREGALLGVLMGTPGRVYSCGQLLGAAFDGVDAAGVVDTYVHYLRRKLGPGMIRTVRGTG